MSNHHPNPPAAVTIPRDDQGNAVPLACPRCSAGTLQPQGGGFFMCNGVLGEGDQAQNCNFHYQEGTPYPPPVEPPEQSLPATEKEVPAVNARPPVRRSRAQQMVDGLGEQNEPATFEGTKGFWCQAGAIFVSHHPNGTPITDAATAVMEYRRAFAANQIPVSHNHHCGTVLREKERFGREGEERLLRINPVVDGSHETQFVCLSGDVLIGRVGVRHVNRRSANMRQLYVEPTYRCRGIGRKLVEACCQVARQSGCETLAFELAPQNASLEENFYVKLGFEFAFLHEDKEAVFLRRLHPENPFRPRLT